MFIQRYNKQVGKDVARLVTTNNPAPSGTYRLGEKIDIFNIPFFNNIKKAVFIIGKENGIYATQF